MIALLPEGIVVNNPEYLKLIKVIAGQTQGVATWVVSLKLDDGSEMMVKTFTKREPAEEMARDCAARINAAIAGEFRPIVAAPEDNLETIVSAVNKRKSNPLLVPTEVNESVESSVEDEDSDGWTGDVGDDDWD